MLVDNVPQQLKEYPNWNMWKKEMVKGKLEKVPYQVGGSRASVKNPKTWTTFDKALKALESGKFDGIGFMFGNSPYCGYD